MRILGLDPSLTSTGWAIIEKDVLMAFDYTLVNCGTIKTTVQSGNFQQRLRIIRREITDKAIHGACAQFAAIEDVFVNRKNMKISIMLAKLHGAVLSEVQNGGFTDNMIKVYAPSFVKETITDYGNASKEQVMKMVKLMTNYNGKSDDESDAIAVALTCAREIGNKSR